MQAGARCEARGRWSKRGGEIELQGANSGRDGPRALAAFAAVPLALGTPPDEIAIKVLFGERCHWFAGLVFREVDGGDADGVRRGKESRNGP